MVDDEVAGDLGVHERGVPAHLGDPVAHGSEVDEDGDAGEVLEEDARGHVLDLGRFALAGLEDRAGMSEEGLAPPLAADDVLEEDEMCQGQLVGAGDGRYVDHEAADRS